MGVVVEVLSVDVVADVAASTSSSNVGKTNTGAVDESAEWEVNGVSGGLDSDDTVVPGVVVVSVG